MNKRSVALWVTLIATFTLAIILLSMVSVLLKGLFDDTIDNTKIFEAMNIVRDVTDPAAREKELKRLFPREDQRQDFLTKYKNLKRLSETGSL